jgi:peptidyl-Lys metalloendopeptidase
MLATLGLLASVACSQTTPSSETDKSSDQSTPLVANASGRLTDVGVSCSLTTHVSDGKPLVRMTLTNDGIQPVQLLPRGTAWDDKTAVFAVTSGSVTARYIGMQAHRGPVQDDEFMALNPGDTSYVDYPISERYAAPSSGAYDVRIAQDTVTVRLGSESVDLQTDCGHVEVALTEFDSAAAVAAQPLTYSSCDTAQQSQFEHIKRVGRAMLDRSFDQVTSTSGIYTRWFGAWTSTRSTSVTTVLTGVRNAWDGQRIACLVDETATNPTGCTPGVLAYVGGGCGSNNVCICPFFWSFPSFVGEDYSQAGTFVHELTHLVGTGDNNTWGPGAAATLASTNPTTAVATASCFEYFISNGFSGIVTSIANSMLN